MASSSCACMKLQNTFDTSLSFLFHPSLFRCSPFVKPFLFQIPESKPSPSALPPQRPSAENVQPPGPPSEWEHPGAQQPQQRGQPACRAPSVFGSFSLFPAQDWGHRSLWWTLRAHRKSGPPGAVPEVSDSGAVYHGAQVGIKFYIYIEEISVGRKVQSVLGVSD